jgi:putative ABC transport system ATP-binding protein
MAAGSGRSDAWEVSLRSTDGRLSKSEAVQAVPSSAALQLISLSKIYGSGTGAVNALKDVTLTFPKASLTAVMGPSGSGKSTLLNCAAGLDRATSGHVLIGDIDLMQLNDKELTLMRRRRVGFVFQSLNLLTALTGEQNILLPLQLANRPTGPEREWLQVLVERMGIAGRIHFRPAKMSIGQQQRVAIARALIAHPDVVFADEPTGALDTRSSAEVLSLLRDAVDALRQTVVMVTHDPTAAAGADRVVFLVDGRIVDDMAAPTVARIAARMTRLEG